jgi:hypothetical protein
MALTDSVVHALPTPSVLRLKSSTNKKGYTSALYDNADIKNAKTTLKGKEGTFTVQRSISDAGGMRVVISFLSSKSSWGRYAFLQLVRTADGNDWAHGANNPLTEGVDVYPRTDPNSGYRVDNRYGFPFFTQQKKTVATDLSDLELTGCTIGGKKTPAKLDDPPGGTVMLSRQSVLASTTFQFFRFEAVASVMDLTSKKILGTVEWVFDCHYGSGKNANTATIHCYEPILMETLLKSKDKTKRDAAQTRFDARNACYDFWNNELVAKDVKWGNSPAQWQNIPGDINTWSYDGAIFKPKKNIFSKIFGLGCSSE